MIARHQTTRRSSSDQGCFRLNWWPRWGPRDWCAREPACRWRLPRLLLASDRSAVRTSVAESGGSSRYGRLTRHPIVDRAKGLPRPVDRVPQLRQEQDYTPRITAPLQLATSAHAAHRRRMGPAVAWSANSRSGSCKHVSSHDGVRASAAASGVKRRYPVGSRGRSAAQLVGAQASRGRCRARSARDTANYRKRASAGRPMTSRVPGGGCPVR